MSSQKYGPRVVGLPRHQVPPIQTVQRRRTFLGNQHLDRMTTCSCPDAWEVVSALSTESDWTRAPCLRSLRHELTLRRVLCNSDVSVVLPLPVLTRNSVVWRQTAYGSRVLVAFVRDAIAASSFSGAVITWETVSLRHGKDFFAIAAFACFQRASRFGRLVTRQENMSLCIREYEIMKFHW